MLAALIALALGSCGIVGYFTLNFKFKQAGSVGHHYCSATTVFDRDYLYMSGAMDDRFSVYDVSDPANMELILSNDTDLGVGGGAAVFLGRMGYLQANSAPHSVSAVDFADPAQPLVRQRDFILQDSRGLCLQGSTLYSAGQLSLQAWSLADPAAPALSSSAELPAALQGTDPVALAASDALVALGSGDSITLFDLASGAPSLAGRLETDYATAATPNQTMLFKGSVLLYVHASGVSAVNCRDPGNPVPAGTADLTTWLSSTNPFEGIALLERRGMLIAGGTGIRTLAFVNIDDPAHPYSVYADGDSSNVTDAIEGIFGLPDSFAANDTAIFLGIYGNPGALISYYY
jgi:hypothetical protein